MTDNTNPTAIEQLSEALADAVARGGASTLTVHARHRIPATGIAWAADGTLITADHVIENEDGITVTLPDGRNLPAKLGGRDTGSDIAVLTVAETAPPESARVGSLVLAIGRPSESPEASFGVVSAAGGPWRSHSGSQIDGYLRTDTTFYPGFSGGPLIDAAGRVIGINSSHLSRGAGITIPHAAVVKIVASILQHGKVRRGYLGIGTQQVRIPAAIGEKLAQETGLLVMSVEAGTTAERGGITIGDIVVAVAGERVANTEDLQAQLGGERVDTAVPVTVLRGGEPSNLTVTIGERG